MLNPTVTMDDLRSLSYAARGKKSNHSSVIARVISSPFSRLPLLFFPHHPRLLASPRAFIHSFARILWISVPAYLAESRSDASSSSRSLVPRDVVYRDRDARANASMYARFPPSAASASSALALSTTASLTPAGRSCTSGRAGASVPRSAAVFSLSTTARATVKRRARCDWATVLFVVRCAARTHGAAVAARVVVADMALVESRARCGWRASPGRIASWNDACARRVGFPTSGVDGEKRVSRCVASTGACARRECSRVDAECRARARASARGRPGAVSDTVIVVYF